MTQTNNRPQSIEYISTDNLHFDSDNPRLPNNVDGGSDEEVINWMLAHENVIELMASIAEKGFFPAEPLLVSPLSNASGQYFVVEGNRRLTAVKLLLNPSLATSRKNSISEIVADSNSIETLHTLPVLVFPSSQDIQQYLGYRHITGVQPWDSLAKARYLQRIYDTSTVNDPEAKYKAIAKSIGSRADHVKLLIMSLKVFNKIEDKAFFHINELNEKTIKFGVLYTAINHDNIANFIGIDLDNPTSINEINEGHLKELSRWIYEKGENNRTRLIESRNLRLLNKIIINPKALDRFREGKTIFEASLLTDEPDEIFIYSIGESLNNIRTARDYVHLIKGYNVIREDDIKEISQIAKLILTHILSAKD